MIRLARLCLIARFSPSPLRGWGAPISDRSTVCIVAGRC
jgi:hypothetical protein